MKSASLPSYYGSLCLAVVALFAGACIRTTKHDAVLLKTEDATQQQLMDEVNRFARVNSMRAKMDLNFVDNSFAAFGSKEVYRAADGEIVVQRPAKIKLTVRVPVIKSDVAQMTSDGETFRVAILQDGGSGKYKKFVKGTNAADYSKLQESLSPENSSSKSGKRPGVNAFANIRPQHFTDALLVRPIDPQYLYTQSTIFQMEEDKTSQVKKVMRGYYLLDEFVKEGMGLKITRRIWFDRVGGIRLARQQLFDAKGEIESDIVYGQEGALTDTGQYPNLPLEIEVTRPREKYSMKLKYQRSDAVTIGATYPDTAFVLQNSWSLEEVDLDKKLAAASATQPPSNTASKGAGTPFQ